MGINLQTQIREAFADALITTPGLLGPSSQINLPLVGDRRCDPAGSRHKVGTQRGLSCPWPFPAQLGSHKVVIGLAGDRTRWEGSSDPKATPPLLAHFGQLEQ